MDKQMIPCIGACCQRRAQCERYAALDFSGPNAFRLYFCPKDANGVGTMFVPLMLKPEIQPERRHA